MSMTIEQVLDLNNKAVFFINEARYLLRHPASSYGARAATSGTVSADLRGLCGDCEAR